MPELSRRKALGSLTTAGFAGLAGCLAVLSENDSTESDEETDGSDSDDSGTDGSGTDDSAELSVTDVSATTIEANCLNPNRNPITVAVSDNVVSVTGVKKAPTPCHKVAVDTSVSDTELSITVTAQPDNSDAECIQCTGAIEYESTVKLSSDAVETITASHADGGPTTSVDADEAPDVLPDQPNTGGNATNGGKTQDQTSHSSDGAEPRLQEIKTVETGCATGDETVDTMHNETTLRVNGAINAADPCHTATVSELTTEDRDLEIVVATKSEDGVCQQCTGTIQYEATVNLGDFDPEKVVVTHADGERFTADLA
ncbi:hypothetical protein ACFQJ7_11940 [Halovenus rubra]|uniref:Uncharacterized protein n=2 Tax=Halovenus rubra TaxID=869890 RepID=A0ACC7E0R2_9EURY|nr:hypothetical protein [Halovenus rubra]